MRCERKTSGHTHQAQESHTHSSAASHRSKDHTRKARKSEKTTEDFKIKHNSVFIKGKKRCASKLPALHQLSSSALQVPADTHKHGEESHGRLLPGRSQRTDQWEAGSPQVTTTVATPTPRQKEEPQTHSHGGYRLRRRT